MPGLVLCLAVEFSQDARWPEKEAASANASCDTEPETQVLQDAPTLTPLFQTGSASSANMNLGLRALILKRIIVTCDQNAAEPTCAPGPRLAILIFRGHSDLKFAVSILL